MNRLPFQLRAFQSVPEAQHGQSMPAGQHLQSILRISRASGGLTLIAVVDVPLKSVVHATLVSSCFGRCEYDTRLCLAMLLCRLCFECIVRGNQKLQRLWQNHLASAAVSMRKWSRPQESVMCSTSLSPTCDAAHYKAVCEHASCLIMLHLPSPPSTWHFLALHWHLAQHVSQNLDPTLRQQLTWLVAPSLGQQLTWHLGLCLSRVSHS